MNFGVLALGDSTYEHYCKTGKDFDTKLETLGANRVLDRVDLDLIFSTSDNFTFSIIRHSSNRHPFDIYLVFAFLLKTFQLHFHQFSYYSKLS